MDVQNIRERIQSWDLQKRLILKDLRETSPLDDKRASLYDELDYVMQKIQELERQLNNEQ